MQVATVFFKFKARVCLCEV